MLPLGQTPLYRDVRTSVNEPDDRTGDFLRTRVTITIASSDDGGGVRKFQRDKTRDFPYNPGVVNLPWTTMSPPMRSCLFFTFCVLTLCCSASAEEKPEPEFSDETFRSEVLPLLSRRCFNCHGPDEESREAGLRLDLRDSAISELDSGEHAIQPGDHEKSELISRILSDDEYLQMPPPESGARLTKDEVDLLKRWIDSGANYARHWSYVPPSKPELSSLPTSEWVRNPIDRFVLKRLHDAGLEPNATADRSTLLRRGALLITGLPPTPEDVKRFESDTLPGAWERAVDRLLASPAFGERWGRIWLDLARYADSAGYAQDPARTIWMYRDWVINQLNANQPFDEFTIEQLAGDLLPNPTHEQMLATAFHRNTMTNSEGGTDDEEFRSAAVVDRVNTTMQVWMGLTMGCAQCHTHKYDPITQEEYFEFYAVFNNTADADRGNEAPVLTTMTSDQQRRLAELKAEIQRLKKEAEIENQQRTLPSGDTELRPRYVRISLPGSGKMVSLAEVQVWSGEKNLALKGKARQSSTDFGGPANLAIDGNTNGEYQQAMSTTHTAVSTDPWWELDLGDERSVDRIVIWNRTDNDLGSRLAGASLILLDANRNALLVDPISQIPNPSTEITVPKLLSDLNGQQEARRRAHLDDESPTLAGRIAELEKRLKGIKGVPTPVMNELPEGKRRKTYIQIRGSFLDRGAEVSAGVPKSFHPLKSTSEPNRLDVANWLISPENPLSARVTVNRFWEQLFGTGIVETSEDFGLQGELPTHPQLLDWLALEFVESDYDVKQLIRTIVTSSTWMQSSTLTAEKREQDPRNALLSRGPRFRLPAEMIRDQALASAGLISRKMLGPSVQPPRPVLGLKAAFGGSTDWKTSTGEDRYRRGLYTSWRRTTPYPSMTTFDAPSREVCTIRRIRTNTPLQALVTMNDPVFIEAAQALARRVLKEAEATTEARATRMFELVLTRQPTDAEKTVIARLVTEATTRYSKDVEAARMMATDPLGPLPNDADPVTYAAWTVVANVIGNLDETLAPR